MPFDPRSQESADWMIGLQRTSTLTPNSILLMSGAITTDDMHTQIGQDSVCVCVQVCVCVCVYSVCPWVLVCAVMSRVI